MKVVGLLGSLALVVALGLVLGPSGWCVDNWTIIKLRLGSVLLAAVAGAGLSVAGVVLQGVLRNPLADPYVLGMSGGAGLGYGLVVITGAAVALGNWMLPAGAFAGALGCMVLVYMLAKTGQNIPVSTLLLAGVIVVPWWLTHPRKTDQQQIVDLLARTERAIEQQDLGGLMQAVSEDYDDGTYNRGELRRTALAGFREVGTIRITPVLRKLEVSGKDAHAELEVDVWIDTDRPRPTMHLAMWVKLSKESGRWLVTSVGGDWPNIPEQSFPYQ